MKIFTLYTQNSKNPADSLKVVPEGFNIGAFFWSLLWLLYNHLWDYFIACSLILLCLINLHEYEIIPSSLISIALIMIPLVLGILGNDLIRKDLEKRSFKLNEIIAAYSLEEAELKFLTNRINNKKSAKTRS